jgi:lipopolysaccharide transport system ATP-binding protein
LARRPREQFQALSEVSLDVAPGEAVGIIGRNGAGKSTLLKILSRITKPTTGRVDIVGRVGSLLEVGTGFHPELTGRENIFLNGSILGMKRREIVAHFDSIVDFAEVHRFLDTPVKRYSSGMYVRLAFAVAAHLDPEILIVDEVLAVGDAAFQKKCLGKMGDAASEQGRTVLFVSHNMAAIESFCTRVVYLSGGRVAADGPTRATIDRYLSDGSHGERTAPGVWDLGDLERVPGTRTIMHRLEVRATDGQPADTIRMGDGLRLDIHTRGLSLPDDVVYIRINTQSGNAMMSFETVMKDLEILRTVPEHDLVTVTIPSLQLSAGNYTIGLSIVDGQQRGRRALDWIETAGEFEVATADVYGSGYNVSPNGPCGVLWADAHWEAWRNGTLVARSVEPDGNGLRTAPDLGLSG